MMLAFGIGDIIRVPFGYLLDILYQFFNNYGVALIAFSIIIKLILLPASAKSKKSSMKMSRLQPQIQYIQKKFEGDQQKYRDLSVVEQWKEQDCVAKMEKYLTDHEVLTAEEIQAIRDEIGARMDAAIAVAELSPEPTPEDLFRNLYAE